MFCVLSGMTYSVACMRLSVWVESDTAACSGSRRRNAPPPMDGYKSQDDTASVRFSVARETLNLVSNVLMNNRVLDTSSASVASACSFREGLIDLPVDGKVYNWAKSFDSLLEDPSGLHTFSEFLKSQFSHENIYFWCSCQRYRLYSDDRRLLAAQNIFKRYLSETAPEPVNIDCEAHQLTLQGLHEAPATLFEEAQEQIYKLMRFDCYPRFLKSSIFEDCVFLEISGEPLPFLGDDKMDPELRLPLSD